MNVIKCNNVLLIVGVMEAVASASSFEMFDRRQTQLSFRAGDTSTEHSANLRLTSADVAAL